MILFHCGRRMNWCAMIAMTEPCHAITPTGYDSMADFLWGRNDVAEVQK